MSNPKENEDDRPEPLRVVSEIVRGAVGCIPQSKWGFRKPLIGESKGMSTML